MALDVFPRDTEVTFYKNNDGKRWVVIWITDVPWALETHPTRISQAEWEEILDVPYARVQEILQKYYY